MPKELKRETSLVRMRLARRDITLDEAQKLFALASTFIPGETWAKFLREQGVSNVVADVAIQAHGEQGLSVDAVVNVKLTYQGDMVRSSPRTRDRINDRLQEIASKTAMQAVFNEIIPKSGKIEPTPGS